MKYFDYELYERVCEGTATEREWLEMCTKCNQEYLLCKNGFSSQFIAWYENGGFHDSVLKDVSTKRKAKGQWMVEICLQKYKGHREVVLRYHGVTAFSIQRDHDTFQSRYEECLYDEFYRLDENEKKSRFAHDFFTTEETFFHIEFTKITCVIRNAGNESLS